MDELEDHLSDILIFELPAAEYLDAFSARLRPDWDGWFEEDGSVWLFSADLAGGSRDLATLLRTAQELLDELGLEAIRFSLDARIYVLESTKAAAAYVETFEAQAGA